MKKAQIILLQILITVSAFGQGDRNIEFDFDYFVLKDSINNTLSFEETAKQIKAYCSNDTQKLCLIAGWIYNNIDFDLDKFRSGGITNDYKTVFALRKGVCGDYSVLFSEFCNRLNITNEIIEGYVPEFDSDNKIYYETNHAWNIVKVGDNWYHCDLLGFSGFLMEYSTNNFEFVKIPNFDCFLTQDLSFLSEHIPADPIWQLSNYPIPLETLRKCGNDSRIDSTNVEFLDYENEIGRYVKLSDQEKLLVFADNAHRYNENNSNVIVINYYNASVDLINDKKKDKQKLILARKHLEKAKKHVKNATNGVEILEGEIEESLRIIKKYVH